MSDVDEFLEHFGKKGMRWGVRNAAKKTAKADQKWAKNANTVKTFLSVHNAAAAKANKIDVPRINNDPKYKGKDFTFDSPLRREYYKAHEDAFNQRRQEAVDKIVGPSPSGLTKIKINNDGSAVFVNVKHAAGEEKVILVFDDSGQITEFKIVDASIAQTALGEEFIAHFGKKGMKWGVRNKTRASGGKINVHKQKAKSLSDEDLRKAVNRMQMEKQFVSLSSDTKTKKGSDFVKQIGTTAVKTALTAVVTQQVTGALKKAKIAK